MSKIPPVRVVTVNLAPVESVAEGYGGAYHGLSFVVFHNAGHTTGSYLRHALKAGKDQ